VSLHSRDLLLDRRIFYLCGRLLARRAAVGLMSRRLIDFPLYRSAASIIAVAAQSPIDLLDGQATAFDLFARAAGDVKPRGAIFRLGRIPRAAMSGAATIIGAPWRQCHDTFQRRMMGWGPARP
jgi:hypothetical protein